MYLQRAFGLCLILFMAFPLAGISQGGTAPRRGLGDLTGPWQLFVDDYAISERTNLTRTYHAFDKHSLNPLPGASSLNGRTTILPLENGAGFQAFARNNRYTSADGLTWKAGDRLKFNGPTRGGSVVHTPWDPGRQFKLFSYAYARWQGDDRDPLNKEGGRYGSYSADGINWFDLPDNPLFLDRTDTGRFNWDPHQTRYFGTPKIFTEARGHLRRSVGFSASPDFKSGWPTARMILIPDSIDDRWVERPGQRTEFYNLSAFAYESMYVGFMEVFRNTDGWKDGHLHIEMVTSRDGIRWKRPEGDRAPILPNGPEGAWDGGMIKVPNHPVVHKDEIWLYYSAGFYPHGFARKEYDSFPLADTKRNGLGLATLRKHGFASLDAGSTTGTVTTRLLRQATGPLRVNFRTAPQGWLKVEALDAAGVVLPGYSRNESELLTGDHVDQIVKWKDSDKIPDRMRRLRFVLQHASLYSFMAGDAFTVDGEEPALAILYTFEGDHGRYTNDRLMEDGAQPGFLTGAAAVDNDKTGDAIDAPVAFGKSGLMFLGAKSQYGLKLRAESLMAGIGLSTSVNQGFGEPIRDTLEIENSFQLGERFTIAAMIQSLHPGTRRLFSAWEPYPIRVEEPPYERDGWIGPKELTFDFDSDGKSDFGCLRLAVQGISVGASCRFAEKGFHHLAATYDNGDVRLFLNGQQVGAGKVPSGPVDLLTNLRVGADPGPFTNNSKGPVPDHQLRGFVDDVLVVGRVLSENDIRRLYKDGAEAVLLPKDPRK